MTPDDAPTGLRFQPNFDPDLGIQSAILAENLACWLRWRLIRTHITGATGRDNSGVHFDEAYAGALRDDVIGVYNSRVLELRRPVRHLGCPTFAGKDFASYESVHLPLSSDGATIDMILIGFVFERTTARRDPFAAF